MIELIIILFVVGYAFIAFEHPLRINKSGTALLMGILIWTAYSIGWSGVGVSSNLSHYLSFQRSHLPSSVSVNKLKYQLRKSLV